MLNFKDLEHYDDFDTEIICWVDVSKVPERFIHEAKRIDGDNYSSACFGVCLIYDKNNKEFSAIEDEDKPGHNLYYIDNNGDKHWFNYRLSEIELGLLAQKVKPSIIEPEKNRYSRQTEHQSMRPGELLENEAVKEFLQLLTENSPRMGVAYSMMLLQMDDMEKQIDKVLNELHEVKGKLAGMQENPAKSFASPMIDMIEGKLYAVEEQLSEMKGRVLEGAKEAVEGFGRLGVKALGQAVSELGLRKVLESMLKGIGESIADVKKTKEKMEDLGYGMGSAGGFLKNVGRAETGKERQDIDSGSKEHFLMAVLFSLKVEKIFLDRLDSMAKSTIRNVESIEQAAEHTKEEAVLETGGEEQKAPGERDKLDVLEPPSDKGKENLSILKDLQEKKVQTAPRPSPVQERGTKSHEGAL